MSADARPPQGPRARAPPSRPAVRPVSRNLFKALNGDDWDPVQLLELRLVGQDPTAALHFNDAGVRNLVWNGATYLPVAMARGRVEEKAASRPGELPSVGMTITNVDRQMARFLQTAEVEGAEVTLWLTDRKLLARPRDAVELTVGEVRDLSIADEALSFQIVDILGQMEQANVPQRLYQARCNYLFGAPGHCGANVNASPTSIHTTAGGTAKVLVLDAPSVLAEAGDPDDPNEFWEDGFVLFKDGANGLQERPIQRVSVDGAALRVVMRYPFLRHPAPGGDPCVIRRNCRRSKADCALYHEDDPSQFGGFEEVPPVRFKPTEKRY